MDYGEIITKSAKLIWKHKILWFFGLLAGLGGGNTNPSFNFNVANLNPGNLNIPQPLQRFFTGMAEMIRQTPGWFFLMLIFLVCGLGLVFFMINVFGRTGLTRGAWQADDGSESLEFGKLVSEIWPAFWRVAGQILLIGLPGFAISLIFFMFLLFGFVTSVSREAPGIILVLLCVGLPMICLMVPFFWFLGIWSQLSTVAVVGEGRGIIDGLKRGWELIRRNLGPVVLVGLLVTARADRIGHPDWLDPRADWHWCVAGQPGFQKWGHIQSGVFPSFFTGRHPAFADFDNVLPELYRHPVDAGFPPPGCSRRGSTPGDCPAAGLSNRAPTGQNTRSVSKIS